MISKYIDAHAHLQFAAYDADREEVIARARDAGVAVINVGTQFDTSKSAVALAERHVGMYAAIGLHPTHTSASHFDSNELPDADKKFVETGEAFDASVYESLAQSRKVVAIGECGLDYFRLDESTKEKQKEVFVAHIEMANRVRKPLMCHIRNAYADAYELLKSHSTVSGDIHFFAGTVEEARRFLDLGFSLSFTGVITFAKQYDEVIKFIPLDRILSETDCPYVTPAPYRGKRNEPAYVTHVVEVFSRIKGVPVDTVAAHVRDNAQKLFGIAL